MNTIRIPERSDELLQPFREALKDLPPDVRRRAFRPVPMPQVPRQLPCRINLLDDETIMIILGGE